MNIISFIKGKFTKQTFIPIPLPLQDKNGHYVCNGDIVIFKSKKGFFGDLMEQYAKLKNLNTINGISYSHSRKYPLMFCYVIEICPLTGVWIKNLHSDYKEPFFTINRKILCDIETFEVVGNINNQIDLLSIL